MTDVSAPADEPPRDGGTSPHRDELSETIELVRRLQAGDDRVLRPLLERLYPRVLRYVRIHMRPGLDKRVGVEDVVQETMLDTFLALDRFEGRENAEFVRYLATIAEHKIIAAVKRETAAKRDIRREESLEQVRSIVSTWGMSVQLPASETAPADRLARTEALEILDDCIASLTPDHRDVILHRDIAGASLDATARILGRETPQAVSMLHTRAKMALAKCAKEKGLF